MADRPNFLILFTDQQRFDTIAAAGYSHMKTPNLDRLANEGCLFTNAYSPNPVCVPARHCLLTGATSKQHGFYNNGGKSIIDDGLPTLPGILAEEGYFTAAVGKMHFRPTRNHNGFLEMHLMEEIPRHRGDDAYSTYLAEQGLGDVRAVHGVRPMIYHEPQVAVMPEEHHGEAWVVNQAINVLEKHGGRPFMMMCGFIKPHPPWNIPKGWQNHYDDVDLPEPIPVCRPEPYFTGESDWHGDNDSDEQKRAIRAAYYTSISFVDHQIGKLLDYLEEQNLLDSTFIIFTSDHGEMLQDRGMYQKENPFESAAHVPFIVRSPTHFAAGTTSDQFVDLMDILPTVLDAAGIDYYGKECRKKYTLPGDSIMKRSDHRDRDYQFSSSGRHPRRWSMMRDKRYKYIYHYSGGFEFLYDLQEDPQELNNLLGTDDLPTADYERLKQKLIDFEVKWGPAEAVVDGQLSVSPYTPPMTSQGKVKFPKWANSQMPVMGRETSEREGELLVNDTLTAVGNPGPEFFKQRAPEQAWLDHWAACFANQNGAEEQCRRLLGDEWIAERANRTTSA